MSKADKKEGIVKPKYQVQPEEVRSRKNKRKPNKLKLSFEESYYVCPFCNSYLGKIDETKSHWYFGRVTGQAYSISVENTNTKCKSCGAFEVQSSCPCCKRNTWFMPDDGTVTSGEYKHEKNRGCGFMGRKL